MIEISFQINGKKVDPNNLADALEAAMLRSVQKSIEQRLGFVRCPVHGTSPTIVCRGDSLEDLKFDISGCCQAVIESTRAALK